MKIFAVIMFLLLADVACAEEFNFHFPKCEDADTVAEFGAVATKIGALIGKNCALEVITRSLAGKGHYSDEEVQSCVEGQLAYTKLDLESLRRATRAVQLLRPPLDKR